MLIARYNTLGATTIMDSRELKAIESAGAALVAGGKWLAGAARSWPARRALIIILPAGAI